MLRPLILKTDTDLKTLAATVTPSRLKPDRVDAAMARISAANPHLDPAKIAAGTVVLIPDGPEFKPSAASSVQSQPFAEFSAMAVAALQTASGAIGKTLANREADRRQVAEGLDSDVFKRLVGNDPEGQRLAEAALKIAAQEAVDDKQALDALSNTFRSAQAALAVFTKIVG